MRRQPHEPLFPACTILWICMLLYPSLSSPAAEEAPASPPSRSRLWLFHIPSLGDDEHLPARIADPRAPLLRAFTGATPFLEALPPQGPSSPWINIIEVSVGMQVPIFLHQITISNRSMTLVPPKLSWGLSIPIGLHTLMVVDGEHPGWPLLNNDYRFGPMFRARLSLPEGWSLLRTHKPMAFAAHFFLGNDSSHKGDELIFSELLSSAPTHPDDRERLNMSAYLWDFGLSVESSSWFAPYLRSLVIEVGSTGLLCLGKGYFERFSDKKTTLCKDDSLQDHLNWRRYKMEPYIGFEFASPYPFALWTPTRALGMLLSMDLRYRIVLDYHYPSSSDQLSYENLDERYQLSFNAILGLWNNGRRFREKGSFNPYVRYYYGVNPNGFLRSQAGFQVIGLGLVMNGL